MDEQTKDMELKQIKEPYPKCPNCEEYLTQYGCHDKNGKETIRQKKAVKIIWDCNKCNARFESDFEEKYWEEL